MSMRSLSAALIAAGLILSSTVASAAAPPAEAELGMICKVYPVADLVIPVAGTFAARTDDGKQTADRTHQDRLIQLIRSAIAPRSWASQGGQGSIDYYPLTMGLVVRQTHPIQDEVAELLAALRHYQDTEVSIELRFITVSDECLAKMGIEDSENGKGCIARLDDTQVKLLLDAALSDTRTNIMQAPRLVVLNGQKATVDATEKQAFVTGVDMVSAGTRTIPLPRVKTVDTGLKISVLPVVTPDNRTLTMQLGFTLTRGDSPTLPTMPVLVAGRSIVTAQVPRFSTRTFQTTLKLTDGTTGLISGWTQHHEVRNQTCPPILGKIPYIGQLFRTISYGKEREHLLVLVTPRIMVQSEKYETQPPAQKSPVAEDSGVIGVSEETEEPPTADESVAPVEPAKPVMHVHRRSFRLDYALENVGPAGVGKLDVWYTRDTKTWSRYDKEVQAKGHATITVPEDGRWGFTLIPYSGTGLATAAPTAGDQPHVWVEVDTTLPQVAIVTACAVQVNGEGKLRVEYRCDDEHLKSHPVSIAIATSPEGPWTVLSRNRDADDTFTYPLDHLPSEFYVCVEAEDQAGNVGKGGKLADPGGFEDSAGA